MRETKRKCKLLVVDCSLVYVNLILANQILTKKC